MKNFMMAATMLTLVACGYSEDKFTDEFADASCEWTVECYPDLYDDVDACLADATGGDDAECVDYDSSAAKDCVEGVQGMSCPAEGEFPEFPSACADVCSMEDSDSGN